MGARTKGKNEWRKFQVWRWDANNKELCTVFNDPRGCRNPCNRGFVHKCNVVLESGRLCGSTSHGRTGHNKDSHGKPKYRQR